jgi:hypothetical protein
VALEAAAQAAAVHHARPVVFRVEGFEARPGLPVRRWADPGCRLAACPAPRCQWEARVQAAGGCPALHRPPFPVPAGREYLGHQHLTSHDRVVERCQVVGEWWAGQGASAARAPAAV